MSLTVTKTRCQVLIGLVENRQQIQRNMGLDQGWKIQLRFLKAQRAIVLN